jgi:acyl carrier protein
MDFLDIVMELRKMYRIQIPEEDYPNLGSMAGTVQYLLPKLKDVAVAT